MKKRLLSLLFAVITIFNMMPWGVMASETETETNDPVPLDVSELEMGKLYSATFDYEYDTFVPYKEDEDGFFMHKGYPEVSNSEAYVSKSDFPQQLIVRRLYEDDEFLVYVTNEDWPEEYEDYRIIKAVEIIITGEYVAPNPPAEGEIVYGEVGLTVGGKTVETLAIAKGDKVYVSADLSDAITGTPTYVWQLLIDSANDVWAVIQDYAYPYAVVSEALIANAGIDGGNVTLRCVAEWNGASYVSSELGISVSESYPDEAPVSDYAASVEPISYNNVESAGDSKVALLSTRAVSEEPATVSLMFTRSVTEEYPKVAKLSTKAASEAFHMQVEYTYKHTSDSKNGDTAANPFTVTIPAGGSFTGTVPSTSIVGYLPVVSAEYKDYIQLPSGITDIEDERMKTSYDGVNYYIADTLAFNAVTAVEGHTLIPVYYIPQNVNFRVLIYEQKLYTDGYDLVDTETKSGIADGPVGEGLAEARTGFTPLFYDPEIIISGDGMTVVKLYYDRNYYLVKFDLNDTDKGSAYGATPLYVRYNTQVMLPTPTLPGYTFNGWELGDVYEGVKQNNSSETVPGDKVTNNSILSDYDQKDGGKLITVQHMVNYKANWETATTSYTVIYWVENADDDNFTLHSFEVVQNATPGTKVSASNSLDMDGNEENYFTYLPDISDKDVVVKGDGTTAVNVYYSRNYYNLIFKASKPCEQPEHTHNAVCQKCDLTVHLHSAECGVVSRTCGKDEHKHIGDCCNLIEHIHTAGCCTIPIHTQHDAICCIIEEHEHGLSCLWGLYCTKTEHSHGEGCMCDDIIHDHTSGCMCSTMSHTHDNGTCNGGKCGKEAHTHTTSCYTYNCGKTEHSHVDSCFCQIPEHTHTTSCTGNSSKNVLTVRRKYDASLIDIWNNSDTSKVPYKSQGWWKSSITNKYYTFLQKMPYQDITLTFSETSGTTYSWDYSLQQLDGSYEVSFSASVKGSGISLTYEEDYFPITGFKQRDNEVPSFSGNKATLYYTRNSYKLIFNDGVNAITGKTESILYEADISGKYFVPDIPSNKEAGSVKFVGWYTTSKCADGTEFDFTGQIMPARNLTLYAKWEDCSYTGKVYLDSSKTELLSEQTVLFGTGITAPDYKDNDKYTSTYKDMIFSGWYYMDGSEEKRFDFNTMVIKQDLDIYAKWTSHVPVQYTVYYVLKDDRSVHVADPMEGECLAGESKTFAALTGADLYEGYRIGYFPTDRSHSIVVTAAGENAVYFEYTAPKKIEYSVVHNFVCDEFQSIIGTDTINLEIEFEIAGTKLENQSASISFDFQDEITKTDPSDPTKLLVDIDKIIAATGKNNLSDDQKDKIKEIIIRLTPDHIEQDLTLTVDKENVVTFNWSERTTVTTYQVIYYLENLNSNGVPDDTYKVDYTLNLVGSVDDDVTAEAIEYNGYTFNSTDSKQTGTITKATIGDPNSGLVLRMYYDRKQYDYTVHHYKQGTTVSIGEYGDESGTAYFGAIIKISDVAKSITGYDLSNGSESIEIVSDEQEIICYYTGKEVIYRYQIAGDTSGGYLSVYAPASVTVGGDRPVATELTLFDGYYLNDLYYQISDSDEKIAVPAAWIDGMTLQPTVPTEELANKTVYVYAEVLPTILEISITEDVEQGAVFNISNSDNSFSMRVVVFGPNRPVFVYGLTYGATYTVTMDRDWAWQYGVSVGTCEVPITEQNNYAPFKLIPPGDGTTSGNNIVTDGANNNQ